MTNTLKHKVQQLLDLLRKPVTRVVYWSRDPGVCLLLVRLWQGSGLSQEAFAVAGGVCPMALKALSEGRHPNRKTRWAPLADLLDPKGTNSVSKHESDLREQVVAMLRGPDTYLQISKRLDIPLGTVGRWAREAGLSRPHKGYTKKTREVALLELRKGRSVDEVAKEVGTSTASVYRWAREANPSIRGRQGPSKQHSQEIYERALAMLESGRTYGQVAMALEIPSGTISHWGQAANIPRTPMYGEDTVQEVLGLYEGGIPVADISEVLGIPKNTIDDWIRIRRNRAW